jgi:hypothetical protein
MKETDGMVAQALNELVVTAAGEVLGKTDMGSVCLALLPLFQQAQALPGPGPLFRRFECRIYGAKACGVQFCSGNVTVDCDGAFLDYAEGDFDESCITKWLD